MLEKQENQTAVKKVLEQKVQFARDCQYFIRRKLEPETEIDEAAEQRRKELSGSWTKYDSALYMFDENFWKTKGKNPFNARNEEHKEEALNYLGNAFPFCFGINLRDQIETCSVDSFNLDLAFYAMCLGATEEQVGTIRSLLRNKKVSTKCRDINMDLLKDSSTQNICIDDIQGSSVEKYQGENLYEVLIGLNDKNVGGFMEYIMKRGGLNNSAAIFKGIGLYQDDEGNIFVAEGNHRIFVYQALKAVKEFITGQEQKGISFDATVQKVRIQEQNAQCWEL